MPAASMPSRNPRFDITVATTVPCASRPDSFIAIDRMARIWSPSMTDPSAATARQRSASPSCATPTSAPFATTAADNRSRWVEPHASLMLRPSGSLPIAMTVEPVRNGGDDVVDVAVGCVWVVVHSSDAGPDRALPLLEQACLDRVFEFVGKLVATTRKELDAVVRHRVVARRQHDSEVGLQVSSQIRNSGRRENAEPQHVDACTGQSGDDSSLEEFTRRARVATNDREWPMALEGSRVAEHMGCSNREFEGELGRQLLVRDTANAVGAKQPEACLLRVHDAHRVVGHAFTAWSTAEPCGPSSDRTSY